MRIAPTLSRLLRRTFEADTRGLVLALALLVLAAFMPRVELGREAFDYLVVIDVTQSMNVEDYTVDGAPMSRLDYARHAVREALRKLPCGSRVGLGAFAEYRTLTVMAPVEVCANYNDLVATLARIDGRMRWSNASQVAKGVFWAVRAAREVGGKPDLLFLSDGHEAPPLRPGDRPLFDDIKPGEIGGALVGVGGLVPRPIPRTDADGRRIGYWRPEDVIQRDYSGTWGSGHEHLSALREPHLQTLARQLEMDYLRLDGTEALSEAMLDPRHARRVRAPTDLSWLPAAAALLLLALRFRPDRWLPRRRAAKA